MPYILSGCLAGAHRQAVPMHPPLPISTPTWHSKFADDTLVTVDFLPRDRRTEVVITHEKLPEAELASHDRGWTSALEKLAACHPDGTGA